MAKPRDPNLPKLGRPLLDINPVTVRELAHIQCTYSEMAAVLRCSVDTLHDHFSALIKEGQEEGKMSLRRAQMKSAMGGNVAMLIWLGKTMLQQREMPYKLEFDNMTLQAKSNTELLELGRKALEEIEASFKQQDVVSVKTSPEEKHEPKPIPEDS